jgi:hypothetical protein
LHTIIPFSRFADIIPPRERKHKGREALKIQERNKPALYGNPADEYNNAKEPMDVPRKNGGKRE